MNAYTQKDLSPIFSSKDKPSRVGWYPATVCPNNAAYIGVMDDKTPFYWWNGKRWQYNKYLGIARVQFWRGLMVKPCV